MPHPSLAQQNKSMCASRPLAMTCAITVGRFVAIGIGGGLAIFSLFAGILVLAEAVKDATGSSAIGLATYVATCGLLWGVGMGVAQCLSNRKAKGA